MLPSDVLCGNHLKRELEAIIKVSPAIVASEDEKRLVIDDAHVCATRSRGSGTDLPCEQMGSWELGAELRGSWAPAKASWDLRLGQDLKREMEGTISDGQG